MRNWIIRIAAELRDNFQLAFNDLWKGKKFWVKIGLLLAPTIVGAIAVSAFSSRLTVQVQVDKPSYADSFGERGLEFSRDKAMDQLLDQLRRCLSDDVSLLSATERETEKERIDKYGRLGFVSVKMPVKITVTNVGFAASTINRVEMSLVEEIDGKRQLIMYSPNFDASCRVGQGEAVEIDGSKGRNFITMDEDYVITDYDLVRIVEEKVGAVRSEKTRPDEKRRLTTAYLLLGLGHDASRLKHLFRLTDLKARCRLLMVVRVFDVYGRNGLGEAEIFDTLAFPAHSEPLAK